MRRQIEFHPDLIECSLEERFLPALPPGLGPTPFMQVNVQTNQIVPTGSGSFSGGGNLVTPGPTYYFLRLGASTGGFGVAGSSVGGTVSIFGLNTRATAIGGSGDGGGGGGGDDAGGGGGNNGTGSRSNSGFGGNFSSGYSFALNSLNNFGMTPTTLGSVPVHTYGGGGDPPAEAQEDPNNPDNAPVEGPNDGTDPSSNPADGVSGPRVNLTNRSLGRSRNAAATLLKGPDPASTSRSTAAPPLNASDPASSQNGAAPRLNGPPPSTSP